MKEIIVGMILGIVVVISLVLAINLEFNIGVPEKIFFPNETIPVNVSVLNRETTFKARNATMGLYIGKREFSYKLGEIKASDLFVKNITLPEFPPGDYIIRGELNYTGFFDEKVTLDTYNSFHVKFPEMKRIPRNIVVKKFIISESIIAGETHKVSIEVSNEGQVAGNLVVGLNSLGKMTSKEIYLEPGQKKTVNLDVKFYNPGISVAEARIYAVIDGIKYLLSFDVKNVYVKEANFAKIEFDKTELVDETDNEINQNDVVKLKINLLNNGTWLASNVKGVLKSSISKIEIIQSEGDFGVIPKNGFSSSIFEIKTSNADIGLVKLAMDVDYTDGVGEHSVNFSIPIDIETSSVCEDFDNDGYDSKSCSDNDNKPNEDCNDFDPNINPGIKDVCDGINNDCDDKKDEDANCGYKKSCVNGACCFDVNNNGACDDSVSCSLLCTPDCELPSEFDWRSTDGPNNNGENENWMTPVKNQGSCGSCWAFSAVGTFEVNYKISSKNPILKIDLSEQQLTSNSGSCCKFCGDCEGGWPHRAFKYVKENSIGSESCFPYTASTVECNLCSDYEHNSYTLTNYERVPANIQDIKKALICKGPLSVASMNWLHAIVLVGYDDASQNWIIKNSWGKWWGDGGYGKIPYVGDAHSDIIKYAYYTGGVAQK